MKNKHVGSTFSAFLEEEEIREEVDLATMKKVLADQIQAQMRQIQVTATQLAARMKTSRTAVNRLLDPNDIGFTFKTLAKASQALDLDLLVSLEMKRKDPPRRRK